MRTVWVCLFLLLPRVGLAWAETLPALYDVVDVASNDVLNLRVEPDVKAEIRGQLAPDAQGVEVTALSADGRWGLVASSEASAWAAMRFLQRVPGPDWDAMLRPLACYGTEPFWSLTISEQGDMAFRDIEGADIALWPAWSATAAGQRGVVGMALGGPAPGFLTLVGQDCTDGMSDRHFGIALTLFLKGDEGTARGTVGYRGCCSLSR